MLEWSEIIALPQGAQLVLREKTWRYFGDYNKIVISVQILLPAAGSQAHDFPGELFRPEQDMRVYDVTTLEQMAVASDKLVEVRRALVENFLETSLKYLKTESFIKKLLLKKTPNKSI